MADSDRDGGGGVAAGPAGLHAAVVAAARPDKSYQLGDFEIDDDGRLSPRPDGAPIAFGFSYLGIDFIARVQTGPQAQVDLSAELGKLPYRAEAGERREMTRRIVAATQGLSRGQIGLSASQDLHLEAQAPAPSPLTPAGVMAAVAAILLEFKPFLGLLHQVMIAPADPVVTDPPAR